MGPKTRLPEEFIIGGEGSEFNLMDHHDVIHHVHEVAMITK